MSYWVSPIPKSDTHWLLLNVHYAKRIPPISYAFGLFYDKEFKGVVTYGIPASAPLCKGVCGEEWRKHVLELNRLCLVDNKPNEASRLVGASLKLLPQPSVIVSYADSAHDHVGYVYQATNFLYTGKTAGHKIYALHSKPNAHEKAILNTVPKGAGRIEALQKMYGDDVYVKQRSIKHRYVFLVGNKTQRKAMRKALRYKVYDYPKEAM